MEAVYSSKVLSIYPAFESYANSRSLEVNGHLFRMREALKELIPEDIRNGGLVSIFSFFDQRLPIVKYHIDEDVPGALVLSLLCNDFPGCEITEFFHHVLKYSLLKGQQSLLVDFSHLSFFLDQAKTRQFYLAKAKIIFHTRDELDHFITAFPSTVEMLKQGVSSRLYMDHVMDKHTMIYDQKMIAVQRAIFKLISKLPATDAKVVLNEISLLQMIIGNEFKEPRSYRHLMRIVYSASWVRSSIKKATQFSSQQHVIEFRLIPAELQFVFGSKSVVGLCLGISHVGEYEVFNERHILQQVKNCLPNAQFVSGSLLHYENPSDHSHVFYLEIEKNCGTRFTIAERKMLRQCLSRRIDGSIERVTSAIFSRYNEEEVMKNILTLSGELTSLRDLPQVTISFESQSPSHLTFVVTLVRIVRKDTIPLERVFTNLSPDWEFIQERAQIVNYLRKKYPREANVFRLKVKKKRSFLRADSSINLYEARGYVIEFLSEKLGEVRDYTGGLIFQQNEIFGHLKRRFEAFSAQHPDALQDFFYSLTPIVAQVTMPFDTIEGVFALFLKAVSERRYEKTKLLIKKETRQDFALAMIALPSSLPPQKLESVLRKHFNGNNELVTTTIGHEGNHYFGIIFHPDDNHIFAKFYADIEHILSGCLRDMLKTRMLRLSIGVFPLALDPRLAFHYEATFVLRMLFDGLMRVGKGGKPKCAIAKSYTISEDQKTYTFRLRDCLWTNGDSVTAHDFEYTWKKILLPNFETSFAYLFYPIKNARRAKMGDVSLDCVGIQAVDDKTLVVELEYPVPYFLDLLTLNLYYPVNRKVDQQHPDWAFRTQKSYVCNGPFRLVESDVGQKLILEKNTHYWDRAHVYLDRLTIGVVSEDVASAMYQQGKNDWLGAPMFPWKESFIDYSGEQYEIASMRSCWLVVNVNRSPLGNEKFRRAISVALNRSQFPAYLPVAAVPAYAPLPEMEKRLQNNVTHDLHLARQLLQEALVEMDITLADLSPLTIFHVEDYKSVRGSLLNQIQKYLKQELGLSIKIEAKPAQNFFRAMVDQKYDFIVLTWNNPVKTSKYLLDAVKAPYKYSYFKWENAEFQEALDEASQETDQAQHLKKLMLAENILMDKGPIIPLYHEVGHCVKNPKLKGFVGNETGSLDFKEAYFETSKDDVENMVQWIE